jgi:hypothetical protein
MSTQRLSTEQLQRLKEGDEEVIVEYLDTGDCDYVDSLGHLCQIGGWPDEEIQPEYRVLSVNIGPSECQVTVTAFFDEKVYGGGCPDMPTRVSREGNAEFVVSLMDGAVSWRTEYWK